jgi:hypothetical protein
VDCHKKSIMLVIMLNAILLNVLATSKVSSMVVEKSNHHPNVKRFESRHHCHQQRLGTRGGGDEMENTMKNMPCQATLTEGEGSLHYDSLN